MKPKKVIIDIMVIISAFLLFIIWYRNQVEDAALTSTSLNQFYKIYLITTDKEYQYWKDMNQGASDMASSMGVTYLWDAPAGRSSQLQIEVINNAVNNGANALLVAADDPKKVAGAIEDAKARGVKIIYVDSPANEEAILTLATDNYGAGKRAGELMLSELKKQGIENGKIGIISIKEKENTDLRIAGFQDIIKANGNYILLDTQYTNGEPDTSLIAAENLIRNNKDLVGLFATNEGTTMGIGNAVKALNRNIIGIGFEKSDPILKLLEEGSLRAVIVQNPYTMGYFGIAEAMAALNGKDTGPSFIDTGFYELTYQTQ